MSSMSTPSDIIRLHNWEGPTADFFSLPLEIREQIYNFALIDPQPIAFSSKRRKVVYDQASPSHFLKWDSFTTPPNLQHLALGLLRCCKAIGFEAARTFYSRNTFAFRGDHSWLPIITWLHSIGIMNRAYLTRMEIDARPLSSAWQRQDGSRHGMYNDHNNEFFPRNASLAPSPPCALGEVENIHPAVETIFAILKQHQTTRTLTLSMILPYNIIPGVWSESDATHCCSPHMSMDMPNLIEKWRADYEGAPHLKPIEVLWIAKCNKSIFPDNRDLIEKASWEILKEEDLESQKRINGKLRAGSVFHIPEKLFVLKRKVLIGVPQAAKAGFSDEYVQASPGLWPSNGSWMPVV